MLNLGLNLLSRRPPSASPPLPPNSASGYVPLPWHRPNSKVTLASHDAIAIGGRLAKLQLPGPSDSPR